MKKRPESLPMGIELPFCTLAMVLVMVLPISAIAQPEQLFELPWNADGPSLSPAGPESTARGPSAVTVGADGTIWILDPIKNLLVGFDRAGGAIAQVHLPAHHNDLVAAARDGSFVLYAVHLRRLTWIGPKGSVLNERTLPLHLAAVRSLGFAADGQLEIEDLHGQRFRLGTRDEPRPDAEVLLDRRYGPPGSQQECGLRKVEGGFMLSRWSKPEGANTGREPSIKPIPLNLGKPASARLVSPCRPGTVLMELERLSSGPKLAVQREVALVEAGVVAGTWRLPANWPTVPAGRFATGEGELILIHPQPSGLQVWRWRLQ